MAGAWFPVPLSSQLPSAEQVHKASLEGFLDEGRQDET